MTDVLRRRELNRATLAPQHLLERAPAGALDMIEHLAGMQSQAPLAPYVGLWTRLRDFAPDSLSTLTEQREVVRIHLMRTTVHLAGALHLGPGWRFAVGGAGSPLLRVSEAGLAGPRSRSRVR